MSFTPTQEAAIHSDERIVCVPAGAGSGKTRVLIERIIRLIEERKADLDDIVAITFTEKAASEMKERLRAAFRARATEDDPDTMTYWRDLERRAATARVSTIHAFCASILRQHALRLGFDPDFRQQTEADTLLSRNAIINATLMRLLEEDNEALLQLTHTMSLHRITQLLLNLFNKRPLVERILETQAFEDPAALMEYRQALLAEERSYQLKALKHSVKFKSYLHRLEAFAGHCSDPNDGAEARRLETLALLQQLKEEDGPQALEDLLQSLAYPEKQSSTKGDWTSTDLRSACTKLNGKVRDWARDALPKEQSHDEQDNAALTVQLIRVFNTVDQALAEYKAQSEVRDFDDLILQTRQILHDHPAIRARVAQGIAYLFMDEFQDTDNAQLQIARLLHEAPEGPHLFIVGDVKQSIYAFRGAEVEVFQDEIDKAQHVHALDQNFRTRPDVFNFINDFFKDTGLLDAVEDYHGMEAMRPQRNESAIEILDTYTNGNVEERCQREAEHIAHRIHTLVSQQHPIEDPETGDLRLTEYRDAALLFRKLTHVHHYERALQHYGIPYLVVAGTGFYKKQEVTDVINFLKVLINPYDEAALAATLRGPLCALSDDTLLQLVQHTDLINAACFAPIPENLEQAPQLKQFRALMQTLHTSIDAPLPDLLQHLYQHSGIEAIYLSMHHGLQRLANLRKLIDLAHDFMQSQHPTLRAFITWLEHLGNQEVREGDALLQAEGANVVTLMTIHKSKGLEFPIVALPGMAANEQGSRGNELRMHRKLGLSIATENEHGEWKQPALGEAIHQRIKIEEEAESARRLYVAMTRARDHLILNTHQNAAIDTWAGILNTWYTPEQFAHGQTIPGNDWAATLYRYEDETFTPPKPPEKETAPPTDLSKLDDCCTPLTLPERPLQQISVSRLLDLLCPNPEEETNNISSTPKLINPLERGTLVHALFEYWDFQSAPPIEKILHNAGLSPDQETCLTQELNDIAHRFLQSPNAKLLQNANHIHREYPFSLNTPNFIINGTIDALLDDYTLIDYKTGHHNPQNESRYQHQLTLYALALYQLTGQLAPAGHIIYVDADHTTTLHFTQDDLEQLQARLQDL